MKNNLSKISLRLFLILLLPLNVLFALPPTITSFTPTSGSVGTLVTITGTNLSSPTALTIGGVSAIAISNTGTILVAMVMPGTITGNVSISTGGGSAISGSGFTIMTSQTPTTQQGGKLVGTGNSGQAYQGVSVSISSDGNTAIVGGYLDNNNQGAAWVFTRNAGVWTQQGSKLVGTGNIGQANQGISVCINADGNTAIVGGNLDNNNQGAAWVFTRNAGVWTQQGSKLVGTGNIGQAYQGYSVGISADGNTAIVGGSVDNNYQGAVWVFKRSAGVWIQQGSKLVGTGNSGQASQGIAVGISADGNTTIVGGYEDNNDQGAVWVFTRSAGVWTQQGNKLVGSGNIGMAFQGVSVGISADGNTAIVGGNLDNNNQGAAWVFNRSAGVWTQQGSKLVGIGNTGIARQGNSVSISADGNTAIVGGKSDNAGQGAAWVYTRSFGNWTQQGSKLAGSGNIGKSALGYSVSISSDGNTALIGGSDDNTSQGAAWVFGSNILFPTISSFTPTIGPVGTLVTITGTNLSSPTSLTVGGIAAIAISNTGTSLVAMLMPGTVTGKVSISTGGGSVISNNNLTIVSSQAPTTQQGAKLNGTGNIGAQLGYSISISADGNTAIVGGHADSLYGAAWVFTRSAGVWTQQGSKLVGTGNTGSANLGVSVCISADGNTAIVGGYNDNTNQGAAWVFIRSAGVWTQQGNKLVGTGNIGTANQGRSVSISADGNTVIIGGPNDNTNKGAVWVFIRSAGVWAQQGGKLVGTGSIGSANQGISVSMSADGNTAIVGGYGDNTDQGAAWVFTRISGVWTQQGNKLVGIGNIGSSNQGRSVGLSADGNTAIVSGYYDNTYQGATWVFIRSAGVWTQQGSKLVGTGNIGQAVQGNSVSISADGNTAIVGGFRDNTLQGAAWVFKRSAGVWTQQGSKLVGAGNAGQSLQGISVSISADGNTAIVGGSNDNTIQGAAWVFKANNVKPIAQFIANKNTGLATDTFIFSDQSSNIPTQWKWTFTPANITYIGGTSSTSQNPKVKFTQAGQYTVKFVATNQYGSDSLTKTQMITISSGGTSSITGTIYNPYINFVSKSLVSPTQANATVLLKQNGNIVSTYKTTSTGTFSFTGLNSASSYDISVKYGTNINDTVRLTYAAVPFGFLNVQLPYSLIGQVNKYVDSLEVRKFPVSAFYNLINTSVNAKGYDETVIRNLLNSSQLITSNHDKKVEALERLLIAQKILAEYSNDGATLCAEGVVSTLDLARSLYGMVTMKEKIVKLIKNGVGGVVADYANKYIEKTVIAGFEVFRDLSKASVESVQDPNLRNSLKAYIDFSFDIIEKAALSNNPDDFAQTLVNDFIENQILNFGTPIYYKNLFVGYTQWSVTQCANKFNGTVAGTLSNSLFQSNIFVISGHAVTQVYLDEIKRQRSDANLKWIADQILGITGNTTQETGLSKIVLKGLKDLDNITQVIKTGSNLAALGNSVLRVYDLNNELGGGITTAFNKKGDGSTSDLIDLNKKSSELTIAYTNYRSKLIEIKNSISANQRSLAVSKIGELIALDSILDQKIEQSSKPILATAPYAKSTVAKVDSLMWFNLLNSIGSSKLNRQGIDYLILAYLLDSTDKSISDSINSNVTSLTSLHSYLDNIISILNNSFSTVTTPARITAISQNIPKFMNKGQLYPVKVIYTNYGNQIATGLYAKIEINNSFKSSKDSIYIGSVAKGISGEINFNITAPNIDTTSPIKISFYSPNNSSDAIGGALVTTTYKFQTSLNKEFIASNKYKYKLNCYPNPFNKSVNIGYNLPVKSEIKLDVYDFSGKLIKSVYSGIEAEGEQLHEVDLSSFDDGLYFYLVKINDQILSGKIIKANRD